MYQDTASKLKTFLAGLGCSGPFNDFSEPCSHYLRLERNARQYIVRGMEDSFTLLEVGKAYRTIGKNIKTLGIREFVKENT